MTEPRTYYLPWPISSNTLWRAVGGRNILSECGRAWFKQAGEELMLQRPVAIKGPVHIHIKLYPPHKRNYDPDNRVKPVLDALVKNGVIKDDNQKINRRTTFEPMQGDERPGAYVTVSPLCAEQAEAA